MKSAVAIYQRRKLPKNPRQMHRLAVTRTYVEFRVQSTGVVEHHDQPKAIEFFRVGA